MNDTDQTFADEPNDGLNVAGNNTFIEDAPGGDLIHRVAEFLDSRSRPQIVGARDPVSDVVAPVILRRNNDGDEVVEGLPAEFFDDYLEQPRFRRGTATLTSLTSFIAHVQRFKDASSIVYACDDRTKPSLTAVLDYHPGNIETSEEFEAQPPRFCRHRSQFSFPLSDEWKAWNAQNGVKNAMSLTDFAAFLEDRIVDVAAPGELPLSESAQTFIDRIGGRDRIATPSDLVALSRGLKIRENAAMSESTNLASGEVELTFVSQQTDESGAPLTIPTSFQIAIPVFRNGDLYAVVARLRVRPRPSLTFWYELYAVDRTFDHAFAEAAERVGEETGLPVLLGSPESS